MLLALLLWGREVHAQGSILPELWRAVETYLRSLHEDRASGEAVAETSGYGALQNLLNAAGAGLRPRVRAVINIKNRGAGIR